MMWSTSPTLTPEIEGWDLTAMAKGSIAKANCKGESGNPCRVPRDRENGDDISEFVWIMAVGLRYSNRIILKICGPKFI